MRRPPKGTVTATTTYVSDVRALIASGIEPPATVALDVKLIHLYDSVTAEQGSQRCLSRARAAMKTPLATTRDTHITWPLLQLTALTAHPGEHGSPASITTQSLEWNGSDAMRCEPAGGHNEAAFHSTGLVDGDVCGGEQCRDACQLAGVRLRDHTRHLAQHAPQRDHDDGDADASD